jgi:hypothetical protein
VSECEKRPRIFEGPRRKFRERPGTLTGAAEQCRVLAEGTRPIDHASDIASASHAMHHPSNAAAIFPRPTAGNENDGRLSSIAADRARVRQDGASDWPKQTDYELNQLPVPHP